MKFSSALFLFFAISTTQSKPLNDVPAEDKCQALNATEPAECPDHIGPPCPPCIINTEPDYTTGDNATISAATQSIISQLIDEYTNYWLSNYGPNVIYPPTDNSSAFTFVEGAGGRAQLFLRLYYYNKNVSYLTIAKEYFNQAITILPAKQEYANYFTGHIGLWTIGAIINDLSFKYEQSVGKNINNNNNMVYDWKTDEYIILINSTLNDVNNAILTNSRYSPKYKIDIESGTLITGISSAMYTGMLLNEYFNDKIISSNIIENIAYYLVRMGLKIGNALNNDYIMFPSPFTPGCFMPGASEGTAGTINQLLNAYLLGYAPQLFSNPTYYNGIKNTLDYYVSIQLSDGNMPTPNTDACYVYGNDSDSRVQWCHGAPGFIDVLSKASMIFSTVFDDITTNKTLITIAETYLTTALGVYNATWQRGLLIKGLMLCHGIGGNAYTILHLYDNLKTLIENVNDSGNNWNGIGKYTMDNIIYFKEQAAWRGRQFVEWTLSEDNTNHLRTKYSDEDYSVWLGSYGMPFIYIQSIQNGWPYSQPVCMPAWNLCVP